MRNNTAKAGAPAGRPVMDAARIAAHFGENFYRELLFKLEKYRKLWELDGLKQIDYYSVNCLFTCRSDKHGNLVLKIGKPGREMQTEYQALSEYDGREFCRVFEGDIPGGALLLEQITPGTRLRDVPEPEERLRIFCEIYRGLHQTCADKGAYPAYADWVESMAGFMRKKTAFAALSGHMDAARRIFYALRSKYNKETLLHGDLHHDNILRGAGGAYRLIDPKGVVGDAVFDLPRFVLNEFGEKTDGAFPEKYRFILRTLSEALAVPEADLKRLVYVEMCLANCWNVESGEQPDMEHVEFTKRMISE